MAGGLVFLTKECSISHYTPLNMNNSTRRQFLSQSLALTAAPWVSKLPAAPSKTLSLACIGVGGHGNGYNMPSFMRENDCRVVAVCDVYKPRWEQALAKVNEKYGDKDCQGYGDFREVLARKDIDAVVISTPDHWHVPISMAALETGKDVFCEKPTLTIAEGRKLEEAVKKHGAVFQAGLEDRSITAYHLLCEAVRNGKIGQLGHIDVELPVHSKVYIEEKQKPPTGLDWNMWLGPAPWAEYSPQRFDWMGWRMMRDYSGGILTDWGAHIVDTAQVGNFAELSGPVSIEGKGEIPEGVMNTAKQTFDITYTYGNGVTMRVKSGGVRLHFQGSEGWCGNKGWRGAPEAHDKTIFKADYTQNKMWPRPVGEHRNFLDSVKSRQRTTYTAEDLHRLSTTLHLGAIAMELGRKLDWNPDTEAFTNDCEANRLRSREARDWAAGA